MAGRLAARPGPGVVFTTEYAQPRQLVSWVLGLGEHAELLSPRSWSTRHRERLARCVERHADRRADFVAEPARRQAPPRAPTRPPPNQNGAGADETTIRPERFARLVALAGILINAARNDRRTQVREVRDRLQLTEQELREDIDLLNVVNFGGGSYVLYAEIQGDEIEVDPEPYSDNFARPARLLPLEAKALMAAIDLLGDHLPEGCLALRSRQDRRPHWERTPSHEGLQIAPPSTTTSRCRARSTPRSPTSACCSSSTTRRTRTSSPSARSSLTP